MKKVFSLIIFAILVVIPFKVNAALDFGGFKCDEKVYEADGTVTETCYIVGKATNGSYLTQFSGTLQLENLTVKSITPSAPWSDYSNGNSLVFRSSENVGGDNFTIATIVFTVNNAAEKCRVVLKPCFDESGNYNCGSDVVVEQTRSCEIDKTNGIYYGKNGEVVTEEVYNSQCVKNPQTGDFLPYVVIAAGIFLAVTVFTVTRKNNALYKI